MVAGDKSSIDPDDAVREFPSGLGCAVDNFRERGEVLELINSLPKIFEDTAAVENAYQRYTTILNTYQEQPHLLDRHLEQMIEATLTITRSCSDEKSKDLKHLSLKFLRLIFKVRGPKEVVRRMPHEVADLVPVLTFLENENLDDPNTWESGYVLTMWLSILVINPFHLKLLDGAKEEPMEVVSNQPLIAERIFNVCMRLVSLNNSIANAAPTLIAKFLTRPDMLELYMKKFIDFACKNLDESSHFAQRQGSFASLSAIFKQGKRQEVIGYGRQVLETVLKSKYEKADTLIRKQGTKLMQRIGMTFLRTKIAPWRYQRGSRSLVHNLRPEQVSEGKSNGSQLQSKVDEAGDYEELSQYSGEIESILDKLFEGIKDKDTIVRWSAAKGIGRVSNRLPKQYADEVMELLLGMFTERETNTGWHGGCLALAELGRRGLLLPERLPSVLPVIKKALIYDEIKGNFSIGAHVRDAGCYVCWAFARAFEPSVIEPFVHELATSLIITMVFDREVNCRRAAAAAFQENVGRQGNFPHGIDIINISDYFSIGNRVNAYTNISVEIAKYPEYTRSLIDHLVTLKYNHFDTAVRELTASALANLTPLDPVYMLFVLTNNFLPKCGDGDIKTSHGAILCLSSILMRLVGLGKLDLSPSEIRDLRNIIPNVFQRQFRGNALGSEVSRLGMIYHIECAARAKIGFHGDQELLDIWHNVLSDCLSFEESTVRSAAAEALPLYLEEYYYPKHVGNMTEYLKGFCTQIESPVLVTRMGYCSSVGRFSPAMLNEELPMIINSLLETLRITTKTESWAEARRDAINALRNIFSHPFIGNAPGFESNGIPIEKVEIKRIYESLLICIEDYTTDKRGDIGSLVREAAMVALKVLTIGIKNFDPLGERGILNKELMTRIIGSIMKQAIEKIDRVRVLAGSTFAALIHHKPQIDEIPHLNEFLEEFPQEFCSGVNWRSPALVFPKFASLLWMEEYVTYLLSGFVVSGGSTADDLMMDSFKGISDYIISIDITELQAFGGILIRIFRENLGSDRITIPMMKFLTQYLSSGLLSGLLIEGQDEFGRNLIDLVKCTMRSTRVDKLFAGIELLCEMIDRDTAVAKLALSRILICMNHVFPRVRVVAAEKLYEVLQTVGEGLGLVEEKLGEVMELISNTNWEEEVGDTRPIRNKICELLGIPVPVMVKRN